MTDCGEGGEQTSEGENAVEHAITSRRSVRGFLPDPIPVSVIRQLLRVAARAPSGSNIQPWHVHVLSGGPLSRLRQELVEAYMTGQPETPEYHYYPRSWRSPYIERRRATGWSLYQLTGVRRGDVDAGRRQRARNYAFFDAPVGMVFTIDRDLERGSWLDFGMFLQALMIAARGHFLDTCPQQSIANYPSIVNRHLAVPSQRMIVCGMALGHADPTEPANGLVTDREGVDVFAEFHTD
ncbi:nitroreductase [Aminobacter sp. MSH1]|uniref:nitroreductase n=1 Tax=Aminobacter sp. MSH1 TaxID=374606 RepID=UPI000D39EBA9|nr:nitroreductase [Aminobacter sp. MSH1]